MLFFIDQVSDLFICWIFFLSNAKKGILTAIWFSEEPPCALPYLIPADSDDGHDGVDAGHRRPLPVRSPPRETDTAAATAPGQFLYTWDLDIFSGFCCWENYKLPIFIHVHNIKLQNCSIDPSIWLAASLSLDFPFVSSVVFFLE